MSVRSVFVIKFADGTFEGPSGGSKDIKHARVFSEKRHANLSISQSVAKEKRAIAWKRLHYPNMPEQAPFDHGTVVELHCEWPGEST